MQIYDLHTHTILSDGDGTVEYLIEKAKEKGYCLGISDHIFCCGIDTIKDIEKYIAYLEQYDVLKGVEANIGQDFTLPDILVARVNYCIASVHAVPDEDGNLINLSKYFGYRSKHLGEYNKNYNSALSEKYMENIIVMLKDSFANQRVDIYGHSTVLPFYEELEGTAFLRDWENDILGLCKKYNVALEISGLWKQPSELVIRKAREMGLKFSFESDCHMLSEVCDLAYVEDMIAKTGICEEELFIPSR